MSIEAAELESRLALACDMARSAGRQALAFTADIGALDVRSKGVQDMVSQADEAVEHGVRSTIAANCPDDDFLGEESCGDYRPNPERGVWVVDPIDGTQPYLCGLPTWCVSIAWFADTRVRVAAVYDPNADELFSARLGGGAHLNGRPMHTAPIARLDEGLVGMGHSNRVSQEITLAAMHRLLAADGMFHRCGSGALSLAHVAAGRLAAYFEPHMNAWDAIGGDLLVREAGGRTNEPVRDVNMLLSGGPMLAAAASVWDAMTAVAGLD